MRAFIALARNQRRRLGEAVLILAAATVMGCGTAAAGETVGDPASDERGVPGDLPATFEGELPCADCPGIFYHLDLFEDRVFFLRTTYDGRGAGAVVDTIGSWVVASDDGRLALFGGTEAPVFFRVLDDGNLRKLDVEGRDIESSLNYDLKRRKEPDPIEPLLKMRGMYRYMADAAVFTECLSGRRFAVAMEADNIALERAYLRAQRQPGEELMISLQGRIAERPAMEGDAMVLTVVPEHFIGVWPGETCGARMVTVELDNTYWKLTRLGDEPVFLGDQQREPHMVLHSGGGRVAGFGGCNQITGSYSVEGATIAFSDIASTMMACADGADTERAFSEALAKAQSWRLIGEHLDLFDGAGDLVARFEARNLE